jgi:hypothetical protein
MLLSGKGQDMSVPRSKIVAALDELIAQEGGMQFQALAVVLAKQRWPQLVASERKNDHGLDAHARGELFQDGMEKGLASSITATLAKIKGDLTTAKRHFPDLTVLLFATPRTVQKAKQEKWREEIMEEFGVSLTVLPREDIITELQKPENAALCETHLAISLPPREPTEEQLFEAAQAATREVDAKWARQLEGMPLIELRMRRGREGEDTTEEVTLSQDLNGLLRTGHRLILEAPAGRGKTTLLIQLSRAANAHGGLSFLINLPAWIPQNVSVMDFVAGMAEFQARGITSGHLAKMEGRTQFTFLLNGWNELASAESLSASTRLRELDLSHPAAGIAVATRAHPVKPPISGSKRFHLLPLNRKQRSKYLLARFGERRQALETQLDGDIVLDELTKTPLILSYVGSLFAAGRAIPATKTGVLNAVIDLMESEPQHTVALSAVPLAGFARNYLEDLACDLMAKGATQIAGMQARQVVLAAAKRLQETGQIATIPEPVAILRELVAHHILEVTTYPDEAFSFTHQQFQELFASQRLLRVLREAVDDALALRSFTGTFVNEPSWAEPLMMVAEQLSQSTEKGAVEAGAALVLGALEVDPVFASELAYVCGTAVWDRVSMKVSARLRALFGSANGLCRALGLTGMLACGVPEFGNLLIPLLSSSNRNERLETYSRYRDFHLSSLGENWQGVVSSWPEDARVDFYSNFIHYRRPPQSLASAALADPSATVRRAGVSALGWIGTSRDLAQLLKTLPEELFAQLVKELPADYIPIQAHSRVRDFLLAEGRNEQLPFRQRVASLDKACELRSEGALDLLKAALDTASPSEVKEVDQRRLQDLFTLLAQRDEAWASAWVKRHVWSRTLSVREWRPFVGDVTAADLTPLVDSIRTEPAVDVYRNSDAYLLQAFGGEDEAANLFQRLTELAPVVRESRHGDSLEGERQMHHQIEHVLRNMRPDAAVAGALRSAASVDDVLALRLICDLFYATDASTREFGTTLSENIQRELHAYLVHSAESALTAEDHAGSLKGQYGILLAEVGTAEDLPIFEKLIQADVARVKSGRLARKTDFRSSQAQGATMSWTVWHVASIIRMAPKAAWNVLMNLFDEPAYELDAAWGLFQLCLREKLPPRVWARNFASRPKDPSQFRKGYGSVQARFLEPQRTQLVEVLRGRYIQLGDGEAETAELGAYRRKSAAAVLAELDSIASRELVYDAFLNAPEQRWLYDGYARVDVLEAILIGGGTLPYEATARILEPLFTHFRKERWNDQEHDRAARAFALLLFTDDPAAGALQIRESFASAPLNVSALLTFVVRVGYSGSPEALEVLEQILSQPHAREHLGNSWIDAIAQIGSSASRDILLGLITGSDNDIPRAGGWGRNDRAAFHLAALFREDDAVRKKLLTLEKSKLSARGRDLLVRTLLQVGTEEALFSCLDAMNASGLDGYTAHKLHEGFEEMFVKHVPISERSNAYRLSPRPANAFRSRLIEVSQTEGPSQESAKRLLMQIEFWRLEHGKPNGEARHPQFAKEVPWPPFCDLPAD